MIIRSDWHIHSEHSYDSSLALVDIANEAMREGLVGFGITDHVNFNEECYFEAIRASSAHVNSLRSEYPTMSLGVELTPVNKPEWEYLAMHGNRDGFEPRESDKPLDMELALTAEQIKEYGVEYVIGASHWRVDVPNRNEPCELEAMIREWHRQQMWLATDSRVTVLGHPWYHGRAMWYEDFTVVPHSMHDELFAALKENGKLIECNPDVLLSYKSSEKFHYQYAEFLREAFEYGLRVSYGSDSHNRYLDRREKVEELLRSVGFADGDFSEVIRKENA